MTTPYAGIAALVDAPLYTGTAATSDVPYVAPVAINGHPYVIDLRQYQRTTLEAQRQPVDQSMEPGEQTLNTEGLWRRSQENWVLGCNQYYLDNVASLYSLYERAGENQSLRYRFWQSKNVDIWTSGRMQLLPLTEEKYTGSTAELTAVTVGDYLYVAEGQVVKFTSNPTASSPTWATYTFQTGTPAAITSITTDGSNLYAACGANGVWKIPGGGVTTGAAKMGTTAPDFVLYGNGRLVTGTGPALAELNSDGTTTAIGTHINPSWFWTCGCAAANAIYIGGSAGHVGEIYATTVASSGTALNPQTLAAPLPPGEIPRSLCYTGGFMAIGTSQGFRIADVSSTTSNGLTFGPVVTGTGTSGTSIGPIDVQGVAAWGEFVYFAWSKYTCPDPLDPSTTVQSSGLGRADMGRFTASLIPAFTTDLQIDDSATSSTDWMVNSVAIVAGNPYFTGSNGAGGAYYVCGGSATKYAASGMFQSGWTRFNTVEQKTVASIEYHCSPLGGGEIGSFLVLETGSVVDLPVYNTVNGLGPTTPYATNFQAGEAFNTQVYLKPDNTQTISPILRRYTIRALITPHRMDEIVLPIMMKTYVEGIQGEGADMWYDVLAEFNFLHDLCNRGVICTYQEGTQSYSVYIDRVQVKPEKWTDEREFLQGTILLRLLTIPAD